MERIVNLKNSIKIADETCTFWVKELHFDSKTMNLESVEISILVTVTIFSGGNSNIEILDSESMLASFQFHFSC